MSLSLSLFFFLYSSCCVENYENWVQNFILLTLSLHSLYADAQGPLQKPLEDERISSRADTFCSRAGDSVVQGVPYVKGPQGSWRSHQDSAYLIRVAVQSMGRARSAPLCHTKAAPGKHGASPRESHICARRNGRVPVPDQDNSSPNIYLLDGKPSHGLHQAASSHQNNYGNPD